MDLLDLGSPQRYAENWIDRYIDDPDADPYDMAADLPWNPDKLAKVAPSIRADPRYPRIHDRVEPIIADD